MHKTNAMLINSKKSGFGKLKNDISKHKWAYIMMLPVVLYYIIFCYVPMFGTIIAFENYSPRKGMFGSEWVGLKHFLAFVTDHYFLRSVVNTFRISFFNILFSFPAPVILALMLNELRGGKFKKTVQTISYFPYFISLTVICGLIKSFCSSDGLFNQIAAMLGASESTAFLQIPEYFDTIYISSGIWTSVGWNSILYMSVLSSVNPEYYEAAEIDGISRLGKIRYITLPFLMPTIIIMLILAIGSILNVGYEKIILLYNPVTYVKADIISSYVYRKGLVETNYSYSAAVGLLQSVVNVVFLCGANFISSKLSETSLW